MLGLGGTMDPRSGMISLPGVPGTGPRLDLGWTFVLQPVDAHTTRLLSRTRYDYSPLALGLCSVRCWNRAVPDGAADAAGPRSRAEVRCAAPRGVHDFVPYGGRVAALT